MQYVLCPRCKFRVALNRHMCGTCGYNMPVAHAGRQVEEDSENKTAKGGFWRYFLGLDIPDEKKADSEQEKKALGGVN